MRAAPWNRHPLLLDGQVTPQDGLHLVVGGKAWWVSPDMVRDWISDRPENPTPCEQVCSTRFMLRLVETILERRGRPAK